MDVDLFGNIKNWPENFFGDEMADLVARTSFVFRTPILSPGSQVGASAIEGVVVRRESNGFTTARAKRVRAEFTRAIGERWSRGPLRLNSLAPGTTPWS